MRLPKLPSREDVVGAIALAIAIVKWGYRFVRGTRGEREAPAESERRGSAQPWTWN